MSTITSIASNDKGGWKELSRILAEILYPMGFDLVKAFPAERYNSNLSSAGTLVPLSATNFKNTDKSISTQHNHSSTLSVIIGNTKHLWPIFLNHYVKNMRENAGDTQCANSTTEEMDDTYKRDNPLDWYTQVSVESAVKSAVSKFAGNTSKYDIRYVFDLSEDRFVAFQQLAQDAGLSYYNKICYLNVHSEYGPWIGLRAVVTFDAEGPPNTPDLFPTLENPYPKGDQLLRTKMDEIFVMNDGGYHQSSKSTSVTESVASIRRDWHKWVELRDIAGGFMTEEMKFKYRYFEEQLEYHYTKNLKLLLKADSQCL
ncbi:11978_t:CDS:2 [Acaulospora colombiana]|uniref:11978_t:CDS:1 n=1 Tax=Acaulospora colombiana TaxID=27376 RepID=A0ACA9KIS1_9GLOM|nr:11978_t:CDS:2 [Acaulospora colombiana]